MNVMAFQSQCLPDAFQLNFSDGINVIIGENGT